MSIDCGNKTNGVYDYDKCVSASRFVTCRCPWEQPLVHRPCYVTVTYHIAVTCHVTVTCHVNRHRLGQVTSLSLSYITQYISQGNVQYCKRGFYVFGPLRSFLHGHDVACLALGHSCRFDINLTNYFSGVMRNVTALERMLSVVFSVICFAGALGLMCQHGG